MCNDVTSMTQLHDKYTIQAKVSQSSSSLAEPDPYAGGEGLVNCYTSTRTIGMHLRHRATHICDVTIGLPVIVYYSYTSTV